MIYISLILLLLTNCKLVEFKEIALYDAYEEPPKKERVDQVIFQDAEGTMWNSLFECGEFAVTTEDAFSGKTSIKLSWNKSGCEWIGFGNSFNNWNATDMSQMRFSKALSLYIRTQEKEAAGAPIVACLEDFEGGGSYHFIGSSNYLKGLKIDTNWTQVIVPLWHFPVNEEEVNIFSIKQMQFQLEGSGSFFLDDIKLIDFNEESYQKMLEEVEDMRPDGELNQDIYPNGRNNFDFDSWGQKNNACQTLKEFENNEGNVTIEWSYDNSECNWTKWGINWNEWYPINFRGVENNSRLSIQLSYSPLSEFKIVLMDFKGHSVDVFNITSEETEKGIVNKSLEIPLKDLELKRKGFVLDQIRELQFQGISPGKVTISSIKISE